GSGTTARMGASGSVTRRQTAGARASSTHVGQGTRAAPSPPAMHHLVVARVSFMCKTIPALTMVMGVPNKGVPMVEQRRQSGETGNLVAIQVRLSEEEIGLLDGFIEQIAQATHGVRISRAQAVKMAALEG